ncbi:hypothetical protein [Lentzea sp. NPDC059081]|uniref:hypothetical protein n=1 Tax=Lentzea sp. NPDC059081 TaxID=3346719 RepID=UPI003689C8E4
MSVRRVALAIALMSLVATPAYAGDDQGAPIYYDSGVAKTPYMGWNTYFGLGAPTEKDVRGVADHLVSSGLRDAGYKIVWIDGGWNAPTPRNARGDLVEDPAKFPGGFDKLVRDLHAQGLKAGIYTDAGPSDGKNCAAGSGGGYYEKDARRFAAWKFDAIKIDFLCGIAANLKPAQAFADFSKAVRKAGRPMILNLCNPVTDEWGVPHGPDQVADISYTFGPLLADSWRTSTDVAFGTPYEGIWRDVLRNMDRNAAHPEANGPGHYNDPDYLIPMRRTQQGTYELNEEESTSQFVMWAQMSSPLIIGSDPRTLPPSMIATLKNPEILAVDQDPLAIQGVRVASTGDTDVYSKVLSRKGERSVVLLNRREVPAAMTVDFAPAGLRGDVTVRDLRARADRGTVSGSYTVTVPAHGTAMLKLRGTDLVPGEAVGSDATASPAIARVGDEALVFSRGVGGELRMLRGGKWSSLGKAIQGQPAVRAVGSDVEVTVRGLDNQAWQRTLHNGRWGGWKPLGGKLTDAPSVSTDGTIVARGPDGRVWLYRGGWTSLGAPGDAPIYGRPSVAGGQVAVRTADDSVWVRPVSGGAWTSLGGVISGSPTMVEFQDRIYLFARASDYTVWQVNSSAGVWGGWFNRPEFPSNSLVGAVGATAGPDGSAWTVVRGPDNKVYRQTL